MISVITREFIFSNHIECVFWCTIGACFVIACLIRPTLDAAVAAVAFGLFGWSDWVEATTGAWWNPWWLLAWKAGCILVFVALLVRYQRSRRKGA